MEYAQFSLAILDEKSILIRKNQEENSISVPIGKIISATYKTQSEQEVSKYVKDIMLLDYLLPDCYFQRNVYYKIGYTILSLTELFSVKVLYFFVGSQNSQNLKAVFIPRINQFVLWLDQKKDTPQKYKELNQLFLFSLLFSYLLNTTFITFPITLSYFFKRHLWRRSPKPSGRIKKLK